MEAWQSGGGGKICGSDSWMRILNCVAVKLFPCSYISECNTIIEERLYFQPAASFLSRFWLKKHIPPPQMFLPWNRGIKMLVEQSSATTQTSTVATFVRRFFGAPGSAPPIINNLKAGDQNQPKQPWKDFRHLSKWSREAIGGRKSEERLWRFSINRMT